MDCLDCLLLWVGRNGRSCTSFDVHHLRQYIRSADVVCSDYHRSVSQLPRVSPSDFVGVIELARKVDGIVSIDNRRLRRIPLPVTKRSIAVQWLSVHSHTPALLKALELAAETKRLASVAEANAALTANSARGHFLVLRLGMASCSRS
jgi:hypothetical protein